MKGAYMAMKEHKLRRYEEWRSQRSYYFQKRYKFGWMESWFIIKTKVLPMKVEQSEEFKRKESIGDGLLSFLVREMIMTDWSMRNTQRIKAEKICSNDYLIYCAVKAGIKPSSSDSSVYPNKRYADKMEVVLYETYQSGGMDAAREWIRLFLVSQYSNYENRATEEASINFLHSKRLGYHD